MQFQSKIIAVVGPTSSGKSELAVKLAKKISPKRGAEILSADSRQVYIGMNIGTGKVPGQWKKLPLDRRPERAKRVEGSLKTYLYKGVIHHGIDIASPKGQYSVARFHRYAQKVIKDMLTQGKIPILTGGTGHWIDAVIFDQQIPKVPPSPKLRRELEAYTTVALFNKLERLDPRRAAHIDRHNRRRLVRALEIILTTGKPVPQLKQVSKFNVLWLGLETQRKTLNKKIEQRLQDRLRQGMLTEIKKLHSPPAGGGLSWKRLENFGLEYKFGALYWQKKLTHPEMHEQLLSSIKHYAKRQMTWWKRNKNIHWVKSESQALSLTRKFLSE